MAITTFDMIREAAEARGAPAEMFHYTMSAAENAADTIAEGNGVAGDFDRLALASLEGLLADGLTPDTDAAAREYFTSLGVRF